MSTLPHADSAPHHRLKYRVIPGKYAVCQLPPHLPIPHWTADAPGLMSITRTVQELSIVCAERIVAAGVKAAKGWICLKLEGPFPFAQTGVLTSFVDTLSRNAIPIFVLSTFDTDYVLTPEEFSSKALQLLAEAGHELISD